MPSQFLRKLKSHTAIPLLFSIALIHINTSQADANELTNLAIEKTVETTANSLLNISVSAQNDEINSPSDLLVIAGTEAAKTSVELMLSKVLSGLVERGILETSSTRLLDRVVTETNKRVQQILSTQTAGQNAIKKGPNSLASGLLVGLFLDVSSEVTKEVLTSEGHPTAGILASYGIQQGKVVYAAKTSGIMGAVVAQSMLTGSQVTEAFKLAAEFDDLKDDANQSAAVAAALDQMLDLRTEYKTAPPSEKQRIEQEIRENLTETLVYDPGLLSSERPIPGAQQLIGSQILAMRQADSNKEQTAEALYNRIENAHPDQAAAYRELALDFIKGNFYDPARWGIQESSVNPAKSQRDKMEDAFDRLETRTRLNVERLRSLTEEARSEGGIGNLSADKQTLMVNLARAIDSNMDTFGPQEVLRRITTSINDYAEKYGVETIDFSIPPQRQEVIVNNTEEPSPTEVDAALPSNEPREEDRAAEQARVLAEQQRQRELAQQQEEQRQADLSDAVDERRDLERSRNETEAKLQEARNLVTVLRFNEAEKAQNELRNIASAIQSLRDRKQASVGFDALGVRQRQITRDILRLRAAIQLRRSLTSPSSITARQKRILNRYADDFGILGRNGQEPWQILLSQAGRILGQRNTELRSIVNRLNAIEAAGVYSDADERDFQKLIRREEELERRLDSLDNRLRIAEANVDRLSGQLSRIDQDITANDIRIGALRRDGDVIDFNSYNIREFAQTDWESFSIFDDYGQINDELPDQSDIQDEIINDHVDNLNPDNDQPGTGGGEDNPYTPTSVADRSEQIGLIAGVSATTDNPSVNPSSTNPGHAQTTTKRNLLVATAPDNGAVRYDERQQNGSREAAYFVKTADDTVGYSHLSWGRSDTVLQEYRSEINANLTMPNIRWMSGTPTSLEYFSNRTGTTDYVGTMQGDFVRSTGEYTFGSVAGNLKLSFNFATSKTTGSGHLDVAGTRWADFIVDGDIGRNSSGHAFAIQDAFLNDSGGERRGSIEGFFFGPNAEETGGVFEYFQSSGTAAGIWTTKKTNERPYTPTTTEDLTNQVGLIAGVTASTNNTAINPSTTNPGNAFTTSRRNLDVVTAPEPGAVRDHDSRGATHIVKTSTESSGYSYLSWGRSRTLLEENRSDISATTVTKDILWMSGSPTPINYFSNRPGTADYSGTMYGDFIAPTGEKTVGNVTGNLSLSFNLDTSKTTGSGNLSVSGNQWADFTVNGALGLTFDKNAFEVSNASMKDTSGDGHGFIEGFFFGASAEEAAGVFEYFKSTGTVAGVWTTKATPTSLPNTNWDGTATYMYARDDGNGGTHPSSGTVRVTDINASKTQLTFRQDDSKSINPGTLDINSNSFSRFSYIGMGSWGSNGSFVVADDGNRPVQFGHWVAYDTTQDLPQTGTATYYGRLNGDYYEPDTDLTRHQAVTGSVELTTNFGTSSISGELEMAVNGSHWTTASFNENILTFNDRHEFEGELHGLGYENTDIRAVFAGPNAEEIGGRFRINSEPTFRNNGSVDGVFGASQSGAPELSFSSTLVAHTSTQTSNRIVYNIGAAVDRVPTQTNSLATISLPASDGGGTVTTTQVFDSGGFDYTSWGRWGSNMDSPNTHDQDGYWVTGNITPASTVENMTGTATYNGGMIGDFVSGSGTRSAATGNIQLTADFSNQSISGNMQFETTGHTSSVAQLHAPISNGSFSQTTSSHGFEGNFFGPNAEEVGGSAWMNDNGGTYNGTFRAAQ